MSAILKFRIAGQGKTFFGDGIGIWFVQQGYYTEGNLHGSTEKFTGVGIIFDTFKNTENAAAHRDVTVLVNDGEKTYEMMTADVKGCNANFRYHNERADFSVTDSTRAKILVEENRLSVFIDATNTGTFADCVEIADIPLLTKDWLKRAYVGITGTTGALADNHDIISLSTYSDFRAMVQLEAEKDEKRLFSSSGGEGVETRLQRIEEAINTILEKMGVSDHRLEHELAGVDDHINSLLGKLEARETTAEGKIGELEKVVKGQVEERLDVRLHRLEDQMNNNLKR